MIKSIARSTRDSNPRILSRVRRRTNLPRDNFEHSASVTLYLYSYPWIAFSLRYFEGRTVSSRNNGRCSPCQLMSRGNRRSFIGWWIIRFFSFHVLLGKGRRGRRRIQVERKKGEKERGGGGGKTEERRKEKQARKLFPRGKRETVEIENIGLFASRVHTYRAYTRGTRNKCYASIGLISWQRIRVKNPEISISGRGRWASKIVGLRWRQGVRAGGVRWTGWIWNKRTAVTISGFQYWRVPGERARYPMCKLSPCILISRRSICRRLRRRCRWLGRWRGRGRRCRRQQHPRKVCNNSLIPDDERLCGGLLPLSLSLFLTPLPLFSSSALQSSRVFDLELSKMHW